jgi:hypothetical protein
MTLAVQEHLPKTQSGKKSSRWEDRQRPVSGYSGWGRILIYIGSQSGKHKDYKYVFKEKKKY